LTVNLAGLTTTEYTVPGGTLLFDTLYYWRVNASNSNGPGNWSQIRAFSIDTAVPHIDSLEPDAPVLISPANGSIDQPLALTLDWGNVTGSFITYDVQVSADRRFTSTVINAVNLTASAYNIISTAHNQVLANNTLYYWRARAKGIGGAGAWSSVWNFTTGNFSDRPTGLNILEGEIPKEFKLYDNFPNPFNPVTKIRFDVPEASLTKISVYDLSGKEVDILLNGNIEAGVYEADFDGSNLSSGIYFYRMESGTHLNTKKMVLVK
jgi:hypothetical protein